MKVIVIAASAAAFACGTRLNGVCSTDSDCAASEQCSRGICLRKAGQSPPGADAGNPGGTADSITLLTPTAGYVPGAIQVSASVSGSAPVTDVRFSLRNLAGTEIAWLTVSKPTGSTYSGTMTGLPQSFSGAATLLALLEQGGQPPVYSSPVSVTVDQVPPQVTTTWDGGVWEALDGSFAVAASASDDLSGVATVALALPDGGYVPGTPSNGGKSYAFSVPAKLVGTPHAVSAVPFSFLAQDVAGNQGDTPDASVLLVDDLPPQITLVPLSATTWYNGNIAFTGTVTDSPGSGVASVSLLANGATLPAAGNAGTYAFQADLKTIAPSFEGALPVQVYARDNVGNGSDAGFPLLVDTVPPAIALQVTTAADYIDAQNVHWYQAAGSSPVIIQAAIDGGRGSPLDGGSIEVAWDGGTLAPAAGSKYAFGVPRSVGAGKEQAVAFAVQAYDTAGNGSIAPISITFDGVSPSMGAALQAPTGWQRRTLPDGGINSIPLEVLVQDNGSGVGAVQAGGSVTLAPVPASNSWAANLPASIAAAGTEGPVSLALSASDNVKNVNQASYPILIDDVAPAIGADTNPATNAADLAWHSASAGNLKFNATAVVVDKGSGVASGTSAPTLNGTVGSLLPDGKTYQFGLTVPSNATLETNAYGATLVAQDNVGNTRSSTLSFLVDNNPPTITNATVDTPADGIDASKVPWYQGPTANPSAPGIAISAAVADKYLNTSTGASPVAIVGSTSYAGVFDSTAQRWRFTIPRAVGQNATAPVAVHFDAQDLAGNHPAAPPSLSLQFDDVPASSFTPAVTADTAWYPRSAIINVALTLATLPRSGVGVALQFSNGAAPVICASQNSTAAPYAYACALPASDAPPLAEGAYPFTVVATSISATSASTAVARNIDDLAPSLATDSSNAANRAFHGAGAFTPSAAVADNGSGVATGSGAPQMSDAAGVLASAQGTAAATAGIWQFAMSVPATPVIETTQYPLTVTARDAVGNVRSVVFNYEIDNNPPVVASPTLDSAFDGKDASGQGWFEGPTANPSAGPINISVAITDKFLNTTAIVAVVNGAPCAATSCTVTQDATTGRWKFAIPRSVGLNASAPVVIGFDAMDLAGNHPVAGSPTLSLQFDDVPASSFSPNIAADASWYARGTGTIGVAVAFAALPRSGLASVLLEAANQTNVTCTAGTSASAYTCVLPTTYAPAGAEASFAFSVVATSFSSLSSTSSGARNIDDVPPALSADTSNPANTAWHAAATFTASEIITDSGSGVTTGTNGPAMTDPAGALPRASGALQSGSSTIWQFALAVPATPVIETTQYPVTVRAQDNVGHPASATVNFQIDNNPPVVASPTIDSAPDGTDGSGQKWFQGPTVAPSAAAINVSASITDKFLNTATPVALVNGAACSPSPCSGTFNSTTGRWSFAIPRSYGLNATAPVSVTFDATDLAGNHPASSSPGLKLNFDDVPGSKFVPSLNTDYSWYVRSSSVNVNITATLATPPRSGVVVQLLPSGSAAVTCTLQSGSSNAYTCLLPTLDAPAGKEAAYALTVTATSVTGIFEQTASNRNVDDVPPQLSADTTNPANTAWHKASAFNASEDIIDNGSGVASGPTLADPAGAMATAAGALQSGSTTVWQFPLTVPTTPVIESSQYPLHLTARDVAGNVSTATLNFAIDNNPPLVASPSIDTAFDGVDAAKQGWFQGPTVNPGGSAIAVSAAITDKYLVAASVVAVVAGTSYAGTYNSSTLRWSFSIPRSVGLNATAPLTVSFDAADQAGNHPVSGSPSLKLYFDDVPASKFTPAVVATSAWYLRSSSVTISVGATLGTLPTSGVSVVLLAGTQPSIACTVNSGSTNAYTCAMPSTYAPAGAEASFSFTVQATSTTRVVASSTASRNVDDVPPSVGADTSNASNTAWHNVNFTATATAADNGSGIAPTPSLGGVSATLQSGTIYSFPVTIPANTETNAYPLALAAKDNVGHSNSAALSFLVDNRPPVIGTPAIATAYDGVDGKGQGWFQGPTVNPTGANIVITATIADGYLNTSSPQATVNTATPTVVAGVYSSTANNWSFSIPRSVGKNQATPLTVSFDATDMAGNHPVAPPTLALYFDDVPASSFRPTITADPTWYARATGSNLAVPVSFTTPPTSGFSSVVLAVSGQASVTCTVGSSGTSASCSLPTAYAPAAAETILSFTVTATSVTKIAASNGGTRNIDDAAPVIIGATVHYPPAAVGALAWGHDGTHFTLKDSGTIFTFNTYDCGAGVATGAYSEAFSPSPATNGISMASIGTQSCANGTTATVYAVTVTGDFTTFPKGAIAGDTAVSVTGYVRDLAQAPGGAAAAHPAQGGGTANVTRRFWQTAGIGASNLVLGPVLAAGTVALNTADGSQAWSTTAGVASFGGGSFFGHSTAVASKGGSITGTLFTINAANGGVSSCTVTATNSCPSGYTALVAYDSGSGFAISGNGAPVFGVGIDTDCYQSTNGIDSYPSGSVLTNATNCAIWQTGKPVVHAFAIGCCGNLFDAEATFDSSLGTQTDYVGVRPLSGTTETASVQTANLSLLLGNVSSNDTVLDGNAYTFNGTAFSLSWSGTAGPVLTNAPLSVVLDSSGNAYHLTNGSLAYGGPGGTAWAVDASPSPVLYWSSGATLSTRTISTGAAAWGLPAVPGTSITDVVMDKNGILYVSSNGQVSAIVTDSPGLGTANYGWAVAGRDACRSYNLGYSCAY